MSKPKRRLVSAALAEADFTSSRDDAITPSQESVTAPQREDAMPVRRGRGVRHGYHASLYLPDEAQFALREIALQMRKVKPHDVMLEAIADLFERYNKAELAAECRARMSRDGVKK